MRSMLAYSCRILDGLWSIPEDDPTDKSQVAIMPAPPYQLIINERSGAFVRCLWFVGYVDENLSEPARSDPNNLVYAEYGPPILRRPSGETMTLEQLSQNPAWESKIADDILLAMVRAQLAAKRHADHAAAATAAANESVNLATNNERNDPPAAGPGEYVYRLDSTGPTSAIRRVRVTRERQSSGGFILRGVQGGDSDRPSEQGIVQDAE